MRKIISFCIYGNADLYNYGLYENALLVPKIFPGWKMAVYYTPTVNMNVINELAKFPYVELEMYPLPDKHRNTMLRFIAGFEIKNDVVIFRDADSRLLKRDYIAVMDWLNNSKKDVHIMRDHPANKSEILAGLWGVRNRVLAVPEIILKFWEYFKDPEYKAWTVDQKYLAKYIYPMIYNNCRVHADFNRREPFATPFPKSAPNRDRGFCGMTVKNIPRAIQKFQLKNVACSKKRANDNTKSMEIPPNIPKKK